MIDGGETFYQVRTDRDKQYRHDKFSVAFDAGEFRRARDGERVQVDDVPPDMIEAGWSLTDLARMLAFGR